MTTLVDVLQCSNDKACDSLHGIVQFLVKWSCFHNPFVLCTLKIPCTIIQLTTKPESTCRVYTAAEGVGRGVFLKNLVFFFSFLP